MQQPLSDPKFADTLPLTLFSFVEDKTGVLAKNESFFIHYVCARTKLAGLSSFFRKSNEKHHENPFYVFLLKPATAQHI